ncbi:MAG: hypothetical protein WA800_02820 [Terriglobales bacterium]
MKSQTTSWGVVSVLAVAGIVGMSMPSGNGHSESNSATSQQRAAHPQKSGTSKATSDEKRACDDIAQVLQSFLDIKNPPRPKSCGPADPTAATAQTLGKDPPPINPNYVIALVPDPIHTHLALMFDRMTEVIQQAAQDENYSYEDSWLPWEDSSQSYALLADDDQASNRTDLREYQPGILAFRKGSPAPNAATKDATNNKTNNANGQTNKATKTPTNSATNKASNNHSKSRNEPNTALLPYRDGLIVFVVGEDPTRGIHLQQFTNALAWIANLNKLSPNKSARTVILGPSFSGSFPSLAKLLADGDSGKYLQQVRAQSKAPLAIYTGSANSGRAITSFDQMRNSSPSLTALDIDFHSFLERDEVGLERYCRYLDQQHYKADSIAIISEDETAYGGSDGGSDKGNGGKGAGGKEAAARAQPPAATQPASKNNNDKNSNDAECLNSALWLYYPRDISALRAAYQSNSVFNTNVAQQPSDVSRGRLPTDLADPEGNEHDTIRSYAGNQTPLSQEAYLLGLVNALRLHHSQYIVLRSTNPLDQLFLARYFRRAYPDARIVTDGSDRLFERDRGSSGMGGAMSLSTYPLLEKQRVWIGASSSGDRIFNSDSTEGTYIAFRLLLHAQALRTDPAAADNCALPRDTGQFNPSTSTIVGSLPPLPTNCQPGDVPIPDYGAPSWMKPKPNPDSDSNSNTNACACPDCACLDNDNSCAAACAASRRPATWLSILGRDGFWAIAAINEDTINPGPRNHNKDHAEASVQTLAEVPISLQLCLLLVALLTGFHLWCCRRASFTAKPSFLTHFANPGTRRHTLLIFLGGFFAAMVPLLAGWGCGVFDRASITPSHFWRVFAVVLIECLIALSAGVVNVLRVAHLGRDNGSRKKPPEPHLDSPTLITAGCIGSALGLIIFFFAYAFPLQDELTPANRLFTYYRNMHLLSGVSPMVPLLFLTIGMYLWFWHSLHGLALFGPDRCRLPARADLQFQIPAAGAPSFASLANGGLPDKPSDILRMFSQEDAADDAENGAKPLARNVALFVVILCSLLLAAVYMLSRSLPVRSLGSQHYTWGFVIYLIFCISLLLAESWQLVTTWSRLRELLMFLDRTPLRRTLAALRGFSWGSVWGMSGNVLDVRYKLLSRQLESLGHTLASLTLASPTPVPPIPVPLNAPAAGQIPPDPICIAELEGTRHDGMKFAGWYAEHYRQTDAGNFELLEMFQRSVAQTAGTLLVRLLLPEWRSEKNSLILDPAARTDGSNDDGDSKDDGGSKDDGDRTSPPLSSKPYIRDAEEFVCLPYLGFVQNLLGRMRTMVMNLLCLFVATALAISTYPFDPRQGLGIAMLALFAVLGASVLYVYAQMHRDATLSHVTNTRPGELGADFWLKILTFGIAPLLGLLTTIFPQLTDFVFGWLQPGLKSIQ